MSLVRKAIARFLGWGAWGRDICPEYVPNALLTPGMIPDRTAPLEEIMRFSLTFDGYWRRGSFNRCTDVPWDRQGETLSEMRACLSHELKCAVSGNLDEAFIRDLLDRMREKVKRGERD